MALPLPLAKGGGDYESFGRRIYGRDQIHLRASIGANEEDGDLRDGEGGEAALHVLREDAAVVVAECAREYIDES